MGSESWLEKEGLGLRELYWEAVEEAERRGGVRETVRRGGVGGPLRGVWCGGVWWAGWGSREGRRDIAGLEERWGGTLGEAGCLEKRPACSANILLVFWARSTVRWKWLSRDLMSSIQRLKQNEELFFVLPLLILLLLSAIRIIWSCYVPGNCLLKIIVCLMLPYLEYLM